MIVVSSARPCSCTPVVVQLQLLVGPKRGARRTFLGQKASTLGNLVIADDWRSGVVQTKVQETKGRSEDKNIIAKEWAQ